MTNLYDALTEYCSSGAYPFHMPGHKRRAASLCDPSRIDITEIDGFDNLHHAEGILKEAQESAAALYGSSETHFLVNGSTAGVLSAIGACARPGACLLMARRSHRSAFNAAALNRLKTAYLYPAHADAFDRPVPVDPLQAEEALEGLENVCAVFLTSPTYDGVVSDVERFAQIAHSHGVPLIVDEAHGAHFGMHPVFPESSVNLGADFVIHSLHKTLPALTQTALIHVNGQLADRSRLRRLLGVYQTSSPSYVLMASIDQCIRLLSERGDALFHSYAGRLERFYEKTKLKHFSLLRTDDPSRILICPPADGALAPGGAPARCSMSAMQLYHILRERFRLQPEMAAVSYVLMLSSVCDEEEGFTRLSDALLTLDRMYEETASGTATADAHIFRAATADAHIFRAAAADAPVSGSVPADPPVSGAAAICTIAQALEAGSQAVLYEQAEGRICAEYLMLYPPGIPLLVPGERIDAGILRFAQKRKLDGYSVVGPEDESLRQIRVLDHSFG